MSILAAIFARLGLAGSVAVALVLMLGVQTFRLHLADNKLDAIATAQKLAKADLAKHEATAQAVTQTAKADLATERVRVETVTRTLIQKVPQYVTDEADRDCSVPVGWSRLWLAGAAGSDPGFPIPAGGSEKPTSPAPHAP